MEEFYTLPSQKLQFAEKIRKMVNRGQNHLNMHTAICRWSSRTGYFKHFLTFPSVKKTLLFLMIHCWKYTYQNLWNLCVQHISMAVYKSTLLFFFVGLSIYNTSTPHPHKIFTFYLEMSFFFYKITFSLMVFP